MPEPLKLFFNEHAVDAIASMVATAQPSFDRQKFVHLSVDGLDALELLPRAKHIALALEQTLTVPANEGLDIITRSLPPVVHVEENHDFTSFVFLPFTFYIHKHGPKYFDAGIHACYEITQRFTAEYCIRPFLEAHTERTLAVLDEWTSDKSHHVRRLVSEGTRPRLPWAARLPMFQSDPWPVIRLLDKLKDDSSLYVRRSVANNLNDVGKDNPHVLTSVCAAWWKGASAERMWVVRHALRSLIKQGNTTALSILGYGNDATIRIQNVDVSPSSPTIGDTITIEFTVVNTAHVIQRCLVDLVVHFVKANGSTSPKVFKLAEMELEPEGERRLRKSISLKQHTTRTHYPGTHSLDVQVNGVRSALGTFTVR